MSTDHFLVQRSDWRLATYIPQLVGEATGQQIVDALNDAVWALNAGSAMASKYGIKTAPYKVGEIDTVIQNIEPGLVAIGSTGDYPSANMALTVNEGDLLIQPDQVYPVGIEFCIVHCQWAHVGWKHDLPIRENFYRSVRRTFAGLFEQQLRQRGI
ncbi:MAG: hypothetical protein ABIH87_00290 [bacterium]